VFATFLLLSATNAINLGAYAWREASNRIPNI
jgi:hypothetical protein